MTVARRFSSPWSALSAPALCTALLRRHPDEWTGPLLGISVLTAMLAASRTAPLGVLSQVFGVLALVTVLLPAVIALNHPALRGPRVGIRSSRHQDRHVVLVDHGAAGAVIGRLGLSGASVPSQWWYSERPGRATAGGHRPVGVSRAGRGCRRRSHHRRRGRPLSLDAARWPTALRPLVVPLVAWAAATAVSTVWTAGLRNHRPDGRHRGGPERRRATASCPALLVAVLAAGIGWIDIMVRRPSVSAGA